MSRHAVFARPAAAGRALAAAPVRAGHLQPGLRRWPFPGRAGRPGRPGDPAGEGDSAGGSHTVLRHGLV